MRGELSISLAYTSLKVAKTRCAAAAADDDDDADDDDAADARLQAEKDAEKARDQRGVASAVARTTALSYSWRIQCRSAPRRLLWRSCSGTLVLSAPEPHISRVAQDALTSAPEP